MKKTDILIIGDGLAALSCGIACNSMGLDYLIVSKIKKHSYDWYEHVQKSFLHKMQALIPIMDVSSHFIPCDKFISAWSTSFTDSIKNEKGYNFNKTKLITTLQNNQIIKNNIMAYHKMNSCKRVGLVWETDVVTYSNEIEKIQSDIILDASGRNANWAIKYGIRKHYLNDHLALSQMYNSDQKMHEHIFSIESMEEGWWYVINIDDRIQVTFITSGNLLKLKDPRLFWEHAISNTYYTKGFVYAAQKINGMQILDTRLGLLQDMQGDGWLAIGDSAFTTDPLCGAGNEIVIDQIEFVKHLLPNVLNHTASLEFDQKYQLFFTDHLKQVSLFYSMENRWPKSHFWT